MTFWGGVQGGRGRVWVGLGGHGEGPGRSGALRDLDIIEGVRGIEYRATLVCVLFPRINVFWSVCVGVQRSINAKIKKLLDFWTPLHRGFRPKEP